MSLREHGVPDRMSDHLALGGAACERSIRALATPTKPGDEVYAQHPSAQDWQVDSIEPSRQ